jgi:hypothetical protein
MVDAFSIGNAARQPREANCGGSLIAAGGNQFQDVAPISMITAVMRSSCEL